MKRYASYSIAGALLVALVWVGCGENQSPIAPDSGQQPRAAAKLAGGGRTLSVQKVKRPKTIVMPNGNVIEKVVTVLYRSGDGIQGGGVGKGDKGNEDCFALFAKGARWKTTEPYVLDPTNGDGLKRKFVASRVAASLETWNTAAGFAIFGPGTTGQVDGADDEGPDGKNEVLFANIDEPGVIAVTIVWGVFTGSPSRREVTEWDMVLDDPVLGELNLGFTWGNAGRTNETGSGDPTVIDLQNVVTHEAGHAAGLEHPKEKKNKDCSEETMYRLIREGETKKRTLHTGDIAGITELYK